MNIQVAASSIDKSKEIYTILLDFWSLIETKNLEQNIVLVKALSGNPTICFAPHGTLGGPPWRYTQVRIVFCPFSFIHTSHLYSKEKEREVIVEWNDQNDILNCYCPTGTEEEDRYWNITSDKRIVLSSREPNEIAKILVKAMTFAMETIRTSVYQNKLDEIQKFEQAIKVLGTQIKLFCGSK